MTVWRAMHEMTHAVGAGTLNAWYDHMLPYSPTRGVWLGARADAEAQRQIEALGARPNMLAWDALSASHNVLMLDYRDFAPFGLLNQWELTEHGFDAHRVMVATCAMMVAMLADMDEPPIEPPPQLTTVNVINSIEVSTMRDVPFPVIDTSQVGNCPYSTTHITYTFESAPQTPIEEDAHARMRVALDAAIKYFECYTNVSSFVSVCAVLE